MPPQGDLINDFKNLNENLYAATKELDEDFHKLLQEEENVQTQLKSELHEDEELIKLTNKGLQVVDQLENIEEKIDQHAVAAEQGQDLNDMTEILGHTPSQIMEDIQLLKRVLANLIQELNEFENEAEATSQEIHTFEDIMDHMQQGLSQLDEMDERIQEVARNYD